MFRNVRDDEVADAAERGGSSSRRVLLLPMVLSLALVVGAVVDQLTTGALEAYSVSMYSAHGVAAEPGAIYGLVYTAGGVLVLLWLLVGLGARAGRRWGPGAAVAAVVVSAALALTMLFVTEYAEPVFPPLWGIGIVSWRDEVEGNNDEWA